ncbi:hypothetical protein RQP46_005909 [Phenoliferia psychrophenolica]
MRSPPQGYLPLAGAENDPPTGPVSEPKVSQIQWAEPTPRRAAAASPGLEVPQIERARSQSPIGGRDKILPTAVRYRYDQHDANYIITGRKGQLTRCEDEPIHCPGAVQSFGVLIAFDVTESGDLVVVQNSPKILGISPVTFFNAKCLTALLTPDGRESLLEALDCLGDSESSSSPYTFELSSCSTPTLSHPKGRPWTAFSALHRPDPVRQPQRACLELELVDSLLVKPPSTQPFGLSPDAFPEMQRMKRMRARTQARSDVAGARKSSELRVVELMGEMEDEFRKSTSILQFAKVLTDVFRELCQCDRVMVYEFDEAWNGEVIAESVDSSATEDVFQGLHFPATDIPPQARELYMRNKV